jgi:pyruvate kinase
VKSFLKSKIVVTIGPATSSAHKLGLLISEGVKVFRFNLSHGSLSFHKETISTLRDEARRRREEVSILLDLPGPKVRLGDFEPFNVKDGDEISIGSKGDVPLFEKAFFEILEKGDTLLLGDGFLRLTVKSVKRERVNTRISGEGRITPHLGISLVGKSFNLPAFTEKDKFLLREALDWEIDLVALSFVLSEKDIISLKKFLNKKGRNLPVVAKLERGEALKNISSILQEAEAVMIARGDLGLTLPLEEVPLVQKRLIREARRVGTPSITATQMLESMIHSSRPTRAEASDVANAIFDGTDCLMLSGETAVGDYPLQAVSTMKKISLLAEKEIDYSSLLTSGRSWAKNEPLDAVSFAACELAYGINAQAILVATATGGTAKRVARFRPPVPIIAVSPHLTTVRGLNLVWGVIPLNVKPCKSTDEMLNQALEASLKSGLIEEGKPVVITSGTIPDIPGGTNLIKVEMV